MYIQYYDRYARKQKKKDDIYKDGLTFMMTHVKNTSRVHRLTSCVSYNNTDVHQVPVHHSDGTYI